MRVVAFLQQIRPSLIDRVTRRLAREENVRESFRDQLVRFFDLLEQAVSTGEPSWLDSILDSWADALIQDALIQDTLVQDALVQSDREKKGASITQLLDTILLATHRAAEEQLEDDQALALIGAILPVYVHAFNYITQHEAQLYVERISTQLENTRLALEKLDRSKSDFISVAAHELKTPLTLIEGYASMIRYNFPESDQESPSVLYLKGMDNGIRRLQEIVNDMIDVSMIDNDMLKLNFQPVWINQLLNIAKRELKKFIQERDLTFEIQKFEGSNEMTYGDPERLYQALRNILTNAIKYTPDGGRINISGRRLPGFVEITISDTGIGIDEAYHEQIFEKFGRLGNAQLHSSSKTNFKGGGPGLGLPITKGLIEAHGGSIWVESDGCDEINCPGTTFHVLLPLHKDSPDRKTARLFESLDSPNPLNKEPRLN